MTRPAPSRPEGLVAAFHALLRQAGRPAVAMLALVLPTLAPPVLAQPMRAAVPGPADRLLIQAAGRCLEVHPAQLAIEGARVQLADCDGRPGQGWRADQGRLLNPASNRCLEVHAPDVGVDGARVQVAACAPAPQQLWSGDGGRLVAAVDGRCLEVFAAEPERGTAQVRTAACASQPPQRWMVVRWPEPAAESVRTVEAGPLFNNGDANRRCPAVCAPGRWTGAWRTTVQGRMSVCDCASAAAAPSPVAPPVPVDLPAVARAPQPMEAARFDELMRAIEVEGFPSSKLRVLESASRDNWFLVAQLRRIVQALTFPADKLRAVEVVAPRLVDRANGFTLYSVFTFDSEREQARALLDRLAPK